MHLDRKSPERIWPPPPSIPVPWEASRRLCERLGRCSWDSSRCSFSVVMRVGQNMKYTWSTCSNICIVYLWWYYDPIETLERLWWAEWCKYHYIISISSTNESQTRNSQQIQENIHFAKEHILHVAPFSVNTWEWHRIPPVALDCASPGYCVCAETRVPSDLEGRQGGDFFWGKFGKVSMVVFLCIDMWWFFRMFWPKKLLVFRHSGREISHFELHNWTNSKNSDEIIAEVHVLLRNSQGRQRQLIRFLPCTIASHWSGLRQRAKPARGKREMKRHGRLNGWYSDMWFGVWGWGHHGPAKFKTIDNMKLI